ncbi:SPW repeat protein [Dietzia sp. SLG310A2-38A2]|uniref:SPW repeat protein n=1 Tax=Dietzia sp. SLG310A2-38A2 TaxID=1630643 RepID=UPI0018895973|nr:SPW repeat protein [Dietzia sp. SLG310A2-38A2]MBB1031477.1 SPW repeat protein [Dietzia sp. SLG310A2-38A2]
MHVISSRIHTIIGLIVGAVLVVAPWIFGFADVEAAKWTAIVVGVVILLSELTTTSPVSPMKLVPMRIHVWTDVLVGVVLAASPWIFGFADNDAKVWVPHLVVGIAVIGYALITRTDDETAATTTRTREPHATSGL